MVEAADTRADVAVHILNHHDPIDIYEGNREEGEWIGAGVANAVHLVTCPQVSATDF